MDADNPENRVPIARLSTKICQRAFEIHAADQDEAVGHAKSRFTDVEATEQWWLRADQIETELVRTPGDAA